MSIASQLATLVANKNAIKAAILAKSPATPLTDALSSWPASIVSISSGGDTPSSESSAKEVKFIDYDGTVLTSYTVVEALALTDMPALPSHEGLSAQGWNYTLAQMKSNLLAGACNIGCMYTTDDGKTRITLTIQDAKYSNIPLVFKQTVANGVEVDWGDGSATQTYSGTSQQTITHQYSPQSYPATYTVTFNVTNGTMSFSSYIMGKSGTESGANPISTWNSMIVSVRIGNGVTSIGNNAFRDCYSLASITISNSVTSIGIRAFSTCTNLAPVTIPNSVTSIDIYAFEYCRQLASITIPCSVTSIGDRAFQYCSQLASIMIPNSITRISDYTFANCYSFASVTIPNSVTSIGGNAFQYCYSLASITIPNSVVSINTYAFSYCCSLASVTIPNSVKYISGNAFQYCYSLASVTIPSSVTSIGIQAFQACYSLAPVTIPSSVTSIGTAAFFQCHSFTSIIIPNSVVRIGDQAFSYCRSLASITIPSSVTRIGAQAFSYCTGIKTFDFRTATAVPQLDNVDAFYTTSSNKEIIVPDELYDTWKGASNWNSTTNYIVNCIVKASESSLGPLS